MTKKDFSYNACVEVFILPPRSGHSVLLLQRAETKKILAGFFAGVGGKIDLDANESPLQAAYRELNEETGLHRRDLVFLELKAVTACSDTWGRWLLFEFVGRLQRKISFGKTTEGRLAWVSIRRLPRIRLVPDLRKGVLQRILKTKKLLWLRTRFNARNALVAKAFVR